MQHKVRCASALLAVIGCVVARWAVPFPLEYSIGIVPVLVAVALFFLYRRALGVAAQMRTQPHWTRTVAVTGVVAVVFAAFLVLGSWVTCEGSGPLSAAHVIATFLNALPLFALMILLWSWLDGRQSASLKECAGVAVDASEGVVLGDAIPAKAIAAQASAESVPGPGGAQPTPPGATPLRRLVLNGLGRWWPLVCFAVLLVCWLPVFLAAYPGFFCYDMTVGDYAEWTQFSDRELNSHHSVFHTLLLGTIIRVVADLTGSFNVGVAVFVGLQALLVAGAFTYVLATLRNSGARPWLCWGSLAYLALDPVVSMFALCTTKDTLFSAAVVLFAALLYRLLSKREKPAAESLVALGLVGVLVCILRPNGIVAFAVATPIVVLLAFKGARLRLLAACGGALLVGLAWLGPASWALDVQGSPIQRLNALSVPTQQIASVYEADTTTLADKAWLESLGYAAEYPYLPENADGARWNFLDMEPAKYAEAYVSLGLKYPGEYFVALLEQTQMAWNPYSYVDIYHTRAYEGRETSLFGFDWESPAISQPVLPWLNEALGAVSGQLTLQNVPLLALLASIPFYLWALCLVVARAIIVWNRRTLAASALFVLLTLSALLGPCVLVRYYLYLFFGLPLLGLMLLSPKQLDD